MQEWSNFTKRWEVRLFHPFPLLNFFPHLSRSPPLKSTCKVDELTIAMAPDEAAPILADFAGKLNMEMSGKFWAPSTSLSPL
jgi:hypothetical protein